jgi:GPH family glycoside/pentoside/hexuronide:cation symporter
VTTQSEVDEERLPFLTKLIYGTGDWGMASFNTLRQIFYAIFLTDVVGLEPRLASVAALFGVIWDGINDPLVGVLSDKVQTRWGRRRPFLLFFAVSYGLAYLLLLWAPPLWGMRLLAGPVAALLLVSAVAVAWFYPLTRQRYARVQRLLARRQRRRMSVHHVES